MGKPPEAHTETHTKFRFPAGGSGKQRDCPKEVMAIIDLALKAAAK